MWTEECLTVVNLTAACWRQSRLDDGGRASSVASVSSCIMLGAMTYRGKAQSHLQIVARRSGEDTCLAHIT